MTFSARPERSGAINRLRTTDPLKRFCGRIVQPYTVKLLRAAGELGMSELQVIQSALATAASRRRWTRALRGLWRGLLIGAILSLLVIAVYHVLPLPLWMLLAAAVVPFAAMLVGFVAGGWSKPALSEMARWVDRQQRLKEHPAPP
jgi:hypothetical protein